MTIFHVSQRHAEGADHMTLPASFSGVLKAGRRWQYQINSVTRYLKSIKTIKRTDFGETSVEFSDRRLITFLSLWQLHITFIKPTQLSKQTRVKNEATQSRQTTSLAHIHSIKNESCKQRCSWHQFYYSKNESRTAVSLSRAPQTLRIPWVRNVTVDNSWQGGAHTICSLISTDLRLVEMTWRSASRLRAFLHTRKTAFNSIYTCCTKPLLRCTNHLPKVRIWYNTECLDVLKEEGFDWAEVKD